MSKMLNVRLSDSEWNSLMESAKLEHLSTSEYVRRTLMERRENPNIIASEQVIRNLSRMQWAIDMKKRKHRNMDFSDLEESMEEILYVLCQRD